MNDFKPDFRFRRLSDITVEDVRSWGVSAVGLDIDHTVCYDCTPIYIEGAGRWLKSLKNSGVPFVFITNSGCLRPFALSARFKAPFVAFAGKPKTAAFERAADKLGLSPSDMAFIGDRLFTDVCGANAAGALSVYVQPPCPDFLYFKNRKKRIKERELLEEENTGDEF